MKGLHHQDAKILGSEDLSLWQKLNSFKLIFDHTCFYIRKGENITINCTMKDPGNPEVCYLRF